MDTETLKITDWESSWNAGWIYERQI